MTVTDLNSNFAIPVHISFSERPENLVIASIENAYATCEISLYGAHLLSFRPKKQEHLIWLSSKSNFEIGKPIRGGIPVCFPWFGPHPTDSSKPVHGFARLKTWSVTNTSALPDGSTQLLLVLTESNETLAEWPFRFKLELKIIVGASLDISLHISNTGQSTFTSSNCLHAYFFIKNLEGIQLSGLKGTYLEPGSDEPRMQSEELLSISKEENRRYFNHTRNIGILDTELKREIVVSKTGSEVTVVWNPWKETVKNIGDIADEDYNSFICVEPTNFYQNETTLASGETHVLGMNVSVKSN